MLIERDGVSFEVTPGPAGDQFWSSHYTGGWEREQAWVLAQVPAGVLLDVGAWIGAWALPAAARGWQVWAYEPDPVAVGELAANVAANPGLPVEVVRAALVKAGHTARLRAQSDVWGGSNSGRWADGSLTLVVAAEPLVEALTRIAPDMVKMDVEGDELDLFPIVAEAGIPCHVSLHAPLARRAGDPADFHRLVPWFARYRRLVVDGDRNHDANLIPFERFCSVTCLDPR